MKEEKLATETRRLILLGSAKKNTPRNLPESHTVKKLNTIIRQINLPVAPQSAKSESKTYLLNYIKASRKGLHNMTKVCCESTLKNNIKTRNIGCSFNSMTPAAFTTTMMDKADLSSLSINQNVPRTLNGLKLAPLTSTQSKRVLNPILISSRLLKKAEQVTKTNQIKNLELAAQYNYKTCSSNNAALFCTVDEVSSPKFAQLPPAVKTPTKRQLIRLRLACTRKLRKEETESDNTICNMTFGRVDVQ